MWIGLGSFMGMFLEREKYVESARSPPEHETGGVSQGDSGELWTRLTGDRP